MVTAKSRLVFSWPNLSKRQRTAQICLLEQLLLLLCSPRYYFQTSTFRRGDSEAKKLFESVLNQKLVLHRKSILPINSISKFFSLCSLNGIYYPLGSTISLYPFIFQLHYVVRFHKICLRQSCLLYRIIVTWNATHTNFLLWLFPSMTSQCRTCYCASAHSDWLCPDTSVSDDFQNCSDWPNRSWVYLNDFTEMNRPLSLTLGTWSQRLNTILGF